MQYPDETLTNIRLKTDETFGTYICNKRVYPLHHAQHPDLLLQQLYETLATYF
jgi:hypothetical protein